MEGRNARPNFGRRKGRYTRSMMLYQKVYCITYKKRYMERRNARPHFGEGADMAIFSVINAPLLTVLSIERTQFRLHCLKEKRQNQTK